MQIDKATLNKIAHLARLEFDDKDTEKMLKDMNGIIAFVEKQHFQQLDHIEIPVYRFQQGITPLSISSDVYLLFEHVFGGPVQPNIIAAYFFLVLLLVG